VIPPDGGGADFWQHRPHTALLEDGRHGGDSQRAADRPPVRAYGLASDRALGRPHGDCGDWLGALRGGYGLRAGGVRPRRSWRSGPRSGRSRSPGAGTVGPSSLPRSSWPWVFGVASWGVLSRHSISRFSWGSRYSLTSWRICW